MQVPEIKQITKSNFARRATLQIKQKLITLPAYGMTIQKKIDFNTALNNNLYGFEHVNYVCGPIHLLGDIIQDKEQRRHLKNDFGEPIEKEYLALREKIWLQDTLCDDLYYASFGEKLKDWKGYSPDVREFLGQIDQNNYPNKFKELRENTKLYMKFIRETVDEQLNLRMDFVMPPVPLFLNDSPQYLIDIWYDMIRTTSILAETKGDKPAAIYLIIHANNFKKLDILNKLMEKIFDQAIKGEIAKIKFVVIKIVDDEQFESGTAGMRIRYKDFMNMLSTFCSNTKRTLIMLDSSSLGLASISLGVDTFIEPMNGVTGIGFRISKDKHGRYYHPEGLKFDSYADIKEYYQNKRSLPCHCKFCSTVNVTSLDELKYPTWWALRRSHLVASRNEEIRECHEAIQQGIISNAIKDKIQRSDVKNYLDLLPK